MNRTLVQRKPAQNQALVTCNVDFPTRLDGSSNHLPTIAQVKRLHGPLAFRKLLGISAIKMRELLEDAGYRLEHHQAVYTWEKAERTPRDLPKHYWKTRYMPGGAVAAYHRLITAFVEWITRGVYRARVTGKRLWRVTLRKAQR